MSETTLQQALRLADEGFYVFPIARNAKTPAHKGWQQEATRDEDEIHQLFANQRGYNIGIFTGKYARGEALTVVDVDTKDGKQGNETMQNMDILGYDFPPTLEFTTASGGRHLVYWNENPISGGANKIGQHVDLKSYGGYIVAEGSTIEGKAYTRANTLSPAHAPQWLIDKCGKPLERQTHDHATSVFDTEQTLDRARDYINHAPEASTGTRNNVGFKVAAHLRDLGVSEPQAHAFMLDWNATKCEPCMDFEEVELLTASAYRSAALAAGNDSPHAIFEAIPHDPKMDDTREPGKETLYYLHPTHTKPQLDFHPLIEDYLDQDAISILYGSSNAGKTFVALDLAYHIAANIPWNNKRVTQGSVAYLAAEGGRSAINRIEALKIRHNNNDFPLALIPCQVNLFDSIPDFTAFNKLIHDIEANRKFGPVRLIVIDTLSRVLAGGNENDSQDMGEFVKNLTAIKEHFKCHVLVVHHSGKDQAKGARGHSLLRAAVDTELEIADNTITTTKQRDMEFQTPQGFELEVITLGTTLWNKDITSCVVNYVDADARNSFNQQNRMAPRDLVTLLALQNYKPEIPVVIGEHRNVINVKTWRQLCETFDFTIVPGAKIWPQAYEGSKKAFERARDNLVAFNRVVQINSKQWAIIEQGHRDITGTSGDMSPQD